MTRRIRAYGLSDVGRVRSLNEDSFAIEPDLGLYLVADGMGGHGHGDVASRLAVESIRRSMGRRGRRRPWVAAFGRSGDPPEAPDKHRLQRALVDANRRLLREVARRPELTGMGTTVVAFVTCGLRAVLAHVGDSRANRLRAGRLEPLTHDHTWVAEQVSAGNLSEDQARDHPFKSVVTRALGGEEQVTVELMEVDLAAGDRYLLCSDGLTGMVSDERIHQRLDTSDSLSSLCNGLIADALAAGGKDNITAVALAVG